MDKTSSKVYDGWDRTARSQFLCDGVNCMKKLMIYLKEYRRQAILAPTFKLLEALMDLFTPLLVARIIDVGIAGRNKSVIYRDFGLMVLLAALGLFFSFIAQYFAARASVGTATKIRQALFDHVQELSYTELDTLGSSTLITRMTSDVQQVQNGLNLTLRLLLRSPFIVFGSMVMAFTINVRCALIFVVAIPVLGAVIYTIMIVSIPLYRKVQSRLDAITGATQENLTGVRVIRAFCKEQDEIREFDQKNEDLTKMNEFVGRISALMNPATYFLINLATIILIHQGAISVNLGGMQQGDVVALYNYMAQMIIELIKLASLIITINRAVACGDRIENILEVKSGMEFPTEGEAEQSASSSGANTSDSMRTSDGKLPDEVVFDHVSLSYSGAGAESISDLNFKVKKGQTVGIIGGTGSGKSSLVNLIPRFYDATKGSVEIDGRNVKDYTEKEIRGKVGVVPQKAVLFEGSIRDNMKMGNADATDADIEEALRISQAKEVVDKKPGRLDFMIEQNGRNLSGGQKQRLTIARALVKKPEILIMDDSSSALDFATDAALRREVRGLSHADPKHPMTVFIVSQRTSAVMAADLILVLQDGEIVGQGTHDELMKNCETYQEIFYSQFPEKRNKSASVNGSKAAEEVRA